MSCEDSTPLTQVVAALERRAFEFVGKSTDGWFKLRGPLSYRGGPALGQCEFQFDPQFIDLPRIRLLEMPPQLPATVPHLGAEGHLCYLAKGTIVLDLFDPTGQLLACLDRAGYVLDRILKGEMVEDLEEEFYAHWGGPYCFFDVQSQALGIQKSVVAKFGDQLVAAVTDDEARTASKLKSLGHDVKDFSILTYRVRTSAKPRPLRTAWPPKTVGDVLAWQGELDGRCRRKIEQRILQGRASRARGALILIESPLMTYGFTVLYELEDAGSGKKRSASGNKVHSLAIVPMSIVRIDDRYIAQRNLIPGLRTLAGKRIALVGCGTIGGFLAEMLVKAGAGAYGGQLTLVDPDDLLPQNLGRHRLGFGSLFHNKAVGIAEELRRASPSANLRPLPVNVMQAQLGPLDLIIDATGEEALGHWLCKNRIPRVPMLSVWVEGPGVAVRGLLNTGRSTACYRCLWHSARDGQLLSVVGSVPVLLAGHGCEGLYVPFPASVSVQAASLGMEMALDWANDKNTPSLRTKIIDPQFQRATPDCDPPPHPQCPVCAS